MPPLKKVAYCFAPVCRSVEQAMSAQYLLTPSLEIAKLGTMDAPRE